MDRNYFTKEQLFLTANELLGTVNIKYIFRQGNYGENVSPVRTEIDNNYN